jgi:hypothetical protein
MGRTDHPATRIRFWPHVSPDMTRTRPGTSCGHRETSPPRTWCRITRTIYYYFTSAIFDPRGTIDLVARLPRRTRAERNASDEAWRELFASLTHRGQARWDRLRERQLSGISHLQCAGCLLGDAAGSLVRLLSSILDAYANLWARVEPAKAPYEASDGRSGGLMASRRATSPLLSHDPSGF